METWKDLPGTIEIDGKLVMLRGFVMEAQQDAVRDVKRKLATAILDDAGQLATKITDNEFVTQYIRQAFVARCINTPSQMEELKHWVNELYDKFKDMR